MKKLAASFLFLFLNTQVWGQLDSNLQFSGYIEAYYGFDLNPTPTNERPPFLVNYRRSNEMAINLASVNVAYANSRVRGNLAFMTGSYAQYNMAAEPVALQHVYEANVGVKLSATKNVWLDMGVLPSHLGLSNPVGKEWWNLTRSLACEGSPYYETGARLQYITANNKWQLAFFILNGWQHIQRPFASKIPALGTQVTYTSGSKFTFNYGTFVGNEFPDTAKQWRYFNNLYAMIQPTTKLGFAVGLDIGLQQQRFNSNKYDSWYTCYVLARYKLTSKWNIAGRVENYTDKHNIISGIQTSSYSLNLDYNILSNAVWRIEGRLFQDKYAIYHNSNTQYAAFTTSLALSF